MAVGLTLVLSTVVLAHAYHPQLPVLDSEHQPHHQPLHTHVVLGSLGYQESVVTDVYKVSDGENLKRVFLLKAA